MRRLLASPGFPAFITVVFLNAFVDLGHKIIIQNTLFKTFAGTTQIALTAVVNALILLPFILVFTPAGFISDRFAKPRVMQWSAFTAVLITLGITACYYLGLFWPAFTLTFVLALQSAIYSPAKYGVIKELVGEPALAVANGAVQAVTTVAILGGTFAFSICFEALLSADEGLTPSATLAAIAPVGWLLVTGSLLEYGLSLRLPAGAPASAEGFDWQRYLRARYLRDNLAAAWHRTGIRLPIIGLSVFWAISQVLVAVFPAYAKAELGVESTVVLQGTIACSGLGIIAGSLLAGYWSRGYIETGLIPLGTLGIAAALFVLPGLPTISWQALDFFLLGALGGFVLVPLNALIQFNAGYVGLGRTLAASNFIQNVVMLGALGLTVVAAAAAFGGQLLLLFLAVTALVATLYTIVRLPQSLLRFVVARLFSVRYRLHVQGLQNLPPQGGVLLLGNHVSWLDWAVVQIASPRPLRFVMDRDIYNQWYLRWLANAFSAIPISPGQSAEALAQVTASLNNGHAVCLFPEGQISRNGHLSEFKRGFERAAAGAEGAIVPFYLHGLWGSRFSRAGAGLRARRRTGRARDIVVGFGEPRALDSSASTVKQAVMELSTACWQRHARTLPTLGAAWLHTAKRLGGAPVVADATADWLSSRRLLIAVLAFAGYLRRHTAPGRLGILLPASSAGMIANLAALLTRRTVVNLNYTAEPASVRMALERAGIKHVVTAERFLRRLQGRGIEVDALLAGVERHDMEAFRAGLGRWGQLRAALAASLLPAAVLERLFGRSPAAEETAAILFSSGSEGTPKGVELSHRNILANARQVADVLDIESDDIVLGNLPLFHAFGLTVTTLLPALEGVPVVCHSDPTDALGHAKAIARQRVTILCSTSTFLRLYTRNRRIHPLMLQTLRMVVSGAERLDPSVREAFERRFNRQIYEGYGATETTPVASANVPDELDVRNWNVQTGCKVGTVGMPLPGTACRVVNPDTLEALTDGEDGMLLIGGVQVMKGYLDDPERTAEAVIELDGRRWYRTGDRGHIDADGFVTIVDRYSRFAKIGGEMISLTRVEEAIRGVLADDECELVAVSVPDARKGERIVLLVDEQASADGVRAAIDASELSALMSPAEIRSVPAIPKLGTGKLDLKTARDLAVSQ